MRISDWSSDVCSSDLRSAGSESEGCRSRRLARRPRDQIRTELVELAIRSTVSAEAALAMGSAARGCLERAAGFGHARRRQRRDPPAERLPRDRVDVVEVDHAVGGDPVRWRQLELGCEATPCSSEGGNRSEEHTSELQY